MRILVLTPCSKTKDDSIPPSLKTLTPHDYVDDARLADKLIKTRNRVLKDPRAQLGSKETYAFDLYVRAGKAYTHIYRYLYKRLRNTLLEDHQITCLFLSGGYGIIHALEKARKYQATFNQSTAYSNGIPYTTPLWHPILTEVCSSIFRKLNPEYVYVFGSRDYTQFVKGTERWKRRDNIKIFESYGSSGPSWISPILHNLMESAMNRDVDKFNRKYPDDFISQKLLMQKTRADENARPLLS